MSEIIEGLLRNANPQFRPWMHYHQEADCLEIHVRPGPTIRRRVDNVMTVYETMHDGEFGGCLLKGVRVLLKQQGGNLGVTIAKGGKIKAKVVVLAYVAQHPEALESHAQEIADVLRQPEMQSCELELTTV